MTDDLDSRRADAKCGSSVRRAHTSSARVKTWRHPYGAYSVVFVETTIGQILDISRVQISAHISTEDATRYFSEAPEANGRTWAGIPLQPRAEEIALALSAGERYQRPAGLVLAGRCDSRHECLHES